MENEFSLKELYDVFIKTTYSMEIAGRQYEEGETLCIFDKIQIANFNQQKQFISAHGGFEDRDRVVWETNKEVELIFSQGIFNSLQFGLLNNARMLYTAQDSAIKIPIQEQLESNENKVVTLSKTPCGQVFFYEKQSGNKIVLTKTSSTTYTAPSAFLEVIANYYYDYTKGAEIITVGTNLIKGFLRLEGKTRVKEDITGTTRTGIIEIPKLRLMSGLSMTLGKKANPVVGTFKALAIPVGTGGTSTVMNFFFLEDDIDTDM